MAGNIPVAIAELSENDVQELIAQSVRDGGHVLVPERYIYNKGADADADPAFDASLPWMDCPPFDLGLLGSSSEAELNKFRSALSTWGCFQIVNHGISSSSLEEMRQVIKQFFELPLEEKQKYSRPVDDLEGYGNDTFVSETKVHDWVDRLYLLTYPVDKRRLRFWPEKPDTLRENMHQFALKMQEILELVLKAAARSLGVEDESFLKQYGENGTIIARLNMYPRCPLPDRVLGFHQHTDSSAITVILQDKQVEGLQILNDDKWFKVPVNADALFINVSDQLEIMSNGIFKSPMHRVVSSTENERISLAMFCLPDPDNDIEPVEELITADRPQMYRRVRNYLEIYVKYYQLGGSAISTMRI